MPYATPTLYITVTGAGTEIPALNVSDPYRKYKIDGTAVSIGNYAIVPTGTPTLDMTYVFEWAATLDITTNGNTFALFGQSINQTQLNQKFTAICVYNGATWEVTLLCSMTGAFITSSNFSAGSVGTTALAADSVTNAKLDNMAANTIKMNNTGSSDNPQDVSRATFVNSYTWGLTGNSGTTAGTNFIGTTDLIDVVFKRNSVEAGRITTNSTSFGMYSFNANVSSGRSSGFGAYSLQNTTTGDNNSAFGYAALLSNTNGQSNTAVGDSALYSNTAGEYNVAVGDSALRTCLEGVNNIGIGNSALFAVISPEGNIGIGAYAGNTITSGQFNTCIGDDSDVSSATALNRIALGAGASATADYQFAIPTDITTVEFGQAVTTTGTNIQKRLTTAANATATLTAAQVKVGYITSTSLAATSLTFPTGTLLGAELGASAGTIFKLYIDNTAGSNTVTMIASVNGVLSALGAANAGSAGLLTIPAGVTGTAEFTLVFSSSTAFTFTRSA